MTTAVLLILRFVQNFEISRKAAVVEERACHLAGRMGRLSHRNRRAIRGRIKPLKRFARKLKEYLPGILAHCHQRLHTSLLEGINNKINMLKRMAYGYRDDEYFFLKIRQALPGAGS